MYEARYTPAPKYRRIDLPGYGDCTPPDDHWDDLDPDTDDDDSTEEE